MNEVQVRQSGEDIKQKLLNKAKNSGTVGRAKLGYINDRKDFDGRLVNTISVDEERAPLITWAFEQYATGDYSATKLASLLAEQGLTTRKSSKWPERPLSRSQLGQILRDPYYIGMVTFKGHVYPGRHEPLITPELFDRVQQVIDARVKRGQRDRVHNHFARGLLHCGRCHAAGREHRLIFAEAKNHAGEIYEYFLCRGRQDGLCDLPYLPVADLERALQREFQTVILSPEGIATVKQEVGAALERVLADQAQRRARLQKELKKLDVQEERLVDLAAEGALATDKLRARLRDLQIKKHEVRASLDTTTESLEQRTQMVLSYLDLMARPYALFTSVPGSVERKLLAAFFQRIWVDDDGHLVTVAYEMQPLPATVRHAALSVTTNEKSAGEISDASSAERANLYLKVIRSSNASLVDLIELFSNNSDGTRLTSDQQGSWAKSVSSSATSTPTFTHQPHAMSRRLGAAATAEIIDRYGEGETAKALAEEFGIARNSVLNILRDNSVVVRRQPPSSEQQIRLTREYESGATIAELVTRYGHSYGAIRRVLKDSEIQMRARGGSAKRR